MFILPGGYCTSSDTNQTTKRSRAYRGDAVSQADAMPRPKAFPRYEYSRRELHPYHIYIRWERERVSTSCHHCLPHYQVALRPAPVPCLTLGTSPGRRSQHNPPIPDAYPSWEMSIHALLQFIHLFFVLQMPG